MIKSIAKRLSEIQKKLDAPKNQWNGFGKYPYRNKEDILEGVKPLLGDDEYINICDDIVSIEGRFYIKATASFNKGDQVISAVAFAREPDQKKGMDASQVTGASSSYAGKYALGNLLAIDDNKDADSGDNRKAKAAPQKAAPKKKPQQKKIKDLPEINQIKADCELWGIPWADDWGERSEGMFGALRKHVDKLISEKQSIDPLPDYMKT